MPDGPAPRTLLPPSSKPPPGLSLQHPAIGYPGAIALSLIALVLRFMLEPWVGNASRIVIFMIFMALSAFIFGTGPGILSTILGVAAADYFFYSPLYSFSGKSSESEITLSAAVVQGILISYCAGYFHRALRLRSEAESKLRVLYETERLAHQAADESNQMKDYFLAVLSHELRGPLSAIQYCVADRLQDSALPSSLTADFELIDRNVRMQSRLISDLLDLTRLSRGKMQIEMQPLDLHELIFEAVRACYPASLETAALAPTVLLNAEVAWISGDRDRLFQILWNILRNAGKFTPPEGRIEVATFHPEPGRIAVQIRDTGIGLSQESLVRIFQPFEQAGSGAKKEGGLGLGLAISRGLAELHGGSLAGASDGLGRGATFTLQLPIVAPPGNPTPTPEVSRLPASETAAR